MKKRILSIVLALTLMLGIMPNLPINGNAASNIVINGVDIGYANGSYFTKNGKSCANSYWSNGRCHHHGICETATSSHCNCMRYWPTGNPNTCKVDLKASQCFGFARYCQYIVYGYHDQNKPGYFTNISGTVSSSNCTANTLKSKLLNCAPATHVRTSSSGKGWAHSVSIVSTNSNNVSFADCNSDGYCKVRYVTYSWAEFASYLKAYGGIVYANSWNRGGNVTTHTHSYSGSYYESAHPHRIYQKCSCGATTYTGKYKTLSSCAQCSLTQDSKYNTVKGFKAYPCVSENFNCYDKDLTTKVGKIYTTDFCTVKELYTNGWCKVLCPWSDGTTKTVYTKISNFIKSPSTALTKYTAKEYINLYSTSSLSTQIYKIYTGDVCYTVGKSGSATQIFMPMTNGGYYVLGWASLPTTTAKTTTYNVPFKCRTISTSKVKCYNDIDFTSSPGYIYPTDDCVITAVYSNGKVKVSCPWSDGKTKTVYVKKSVFINSSSTPKNMTAPKYAKTYLRTDMGTNIGWIDANDKIQIVATSGNKTQIIYPADSGKRCAWVYTSDLTKNYTVKYNANGGSGAPSSQTKTHDKDLTLSSTKPTRTGYTFVGWATSSSATSATYSSGSIYSKNAAVTLYAVWRKQNFTVTYKANGGHGAPGAQTQTYNTAITVTSQQAEKTYEVIFNPNGGTVSPTYYNIACTFVSWNTNKNGTGTTVKSGSSYKPNANVTLYAIYTNPQLGGYPIPSRTGYTFNGWYTAASGGSRVNSSTVISDNTTLYAQWSIETYSVVYYDDGCSNLPPEQSKEHGSTLILSNKVPVKAGYTFKGWATEEGSDTVVYLPGAQYTADDWAILYAVWEKNPATLTSISIENGPSKTVYQIGDTLNTSGLKLKLTYSDNSSQYVTSGFTTSGFSSATAGVKTVTVSYGGKTTNYTVKVEEPAVSTDAKYEISNAVGTAGSTVDVYISIDNNPGIISLRNTVSYDTTALELIGVRDCGLLSGYTTPSSTVTSPYTLRWADSLATANNTRNGQLVQLSFKIKDNTQAGSYNISVSPVEARNANGTKITFAGAAATIDVTDSSVGDIDGDGEITDWDAIMLNRYLASWNVSIQLSAADIDGDGDISDWDAILLERHLAGWKIEGLE